VAGFEHDFRFEILTLVRLPASVAFRLCPARC
jgi:hypothetical protein